MKFWEAMKALEEGKKVRAKSWGPNQWFSNSDESNALPSLHLSNLLNGEWELYQEPVQLNFAQMVQQLEERKKYSRKHWIKDGCDPITKYTIQHQTFYYDDFTATDWVEVK